MSKVAVRYEFKTEAGWVDCTRETYEALRDKDQPVRALAAIEKDEPVKKGLPDGWRVSLDERNGTGTATISGPGCYCLEIQVSGSSLDFMRSMAKASE